MLGGAVVSLLNTVTCRLTKEQNLDIPIQNTRLYLLSQQVLWGVSTKIKHCRTEC